MFLLAEVGTFPTYFVVGFIAAVSIGSIAWYNSKRPAGWEDVKRPDVVPDMDLDKKSEPDQKNS